MIMSYLSEQQATFNKQGYVVIPSLLSPDELAFLRRVLQDTLGQAESQHSLERKGQIKFVFTRHAGARELLLRLARRPQVLPLIVSFQSRPFIDHTKSLVKMRVAAVRPGTRTPTTGRSTTPSTRWRRSGSR